MVIVPIILAADSGFELGFPKALAQFGRKSALEIALASCAGLAQPIVVVSPKLAKLVASDRQAFRWCPNLDVGAAPYRPSCGGKNIGTATGVRPYVELQCCVVVHRRGPRGQVGSLLAGLRLVPAAAAFMVYAVDYPLLTAAVVGRLADAFAGRRTHQSIVLPRYRGRAGHPVIFAPELRRELERAESARAVIYRDPRRVRFVSVRDSSITKDFDTPAAYRRVLGEYLRRSQG